jgi:hypothetical protein
VGDLPDIAQVFPGFELYVEGSGITGERAECCAGTAHLVCTQPTDMRCSFDGLSAPPRYPAGDLHDQRSQIAELLDAQGTEELRSLSKRRVDLQAANLGSNLVMPFRNHG